MNTQIQPKTTRILILAFIIFSLLACSTEEQEFFETEMSVAGKTLVSAAETEVGDTGKTVVSSAKTQLMEEGGTAVADGLDLASTEVAHLKETALAGVSSLLPITELPITQNNKVLDYFALGDSIASGHGLMDDGSDCKRSERAYPHKLRKLLLERYGEVRIYHFACSGASVIQPKESELKKDSKKWLHNQVNDALAMISDQQEQHPTLVTITIGANDTGWHDLSVLWRIIIPGVNYLNWVDEIKTKISKGLYEEVKRLLDGNPNVSVLITTNPNPINEESIFFFVEGNQCRDPLNTLKCYERSEYLIYGLNAQFYDDILHKYNQLDRIRIVPITAKFKGHESPKPSCGKAGPVEDETWIQQANDPNSNSQLEGKWKYIFPDIKTGDCIHPNEKGAEAIANMIIEYVPLVGK